MFSAADDNFFSRIKSNSLHVLQPYLPDHNDIPYQLRARSQSLALINKLNSLMTPTSSYAYSTSTLTDLYIRVNDIH